jgi:hypothetical protein
MCEGDEDVLADLVASDWIDKWFRNVNMVYE